MEVQEGSGRAKNGAPSQKRGRRTKSDLMAEIPFPRASGTCSAAEGIHYDAWAWNVLSSGHFGVGELREMKLARRERTGGRGDGLFRRVSYCADVPDVRLANTSEKQRRCNGEANLDAIVAMWSKQRVQEAIKGLGKRGEERGGRERPGSLSRLLRA
jgi:hypothetical protein